MFIELNISYFLGSLYSCPMDKDLAAAVLNGFSSGAKINDTMLEKAAQCIGVDSREIVKEARLRTYISTYLEKGASSPVFEDYLSAACGVSKGRLEKIAKLYSIPLEKVAITYLQARNFQVDGKIAEFDDGVASGQNLQQDPSALQQPQLPPGALTSQDPFGNTMFQPSPSAPAQVPPSEDGNMGQLMENDQNKEQIQAEQEQLGADQMLQQAGQAEMQPGATGQYSKEQIQQALSMADSQGKMQYAFPGASEQEMARAIEALDNVEAQTGLKVSDPAQLKKIVGEIQKENKKVIDEAIKAQFGGTGGGGPGEATGPLPPPAQENQGGATDMSKMAFLLRKVRRY